MRYSFLDPWHAFLPREAGHVVALCGSGGKTSLLMEIARLWAAEGLPVVATTTTRTEQLADVLAVDSTATTAAAATAPVVYRHGGVRADGKWEGIAASVVDAIDSELPGRLVVVEVDGAAKRPFKYYRAGEPVWPQRTSLALVVMGVGGVGDLAGEVVHRLGREDVTDPVGVAAGDVWQWDQAYTLLTGPGGYLDQVPDGVPVVLVLAGLEQQPDSIGLFGFTGRAMEHPRVPLVLFCSRGEGGLSLRAACRLEGEDEDAADVHPGDDHDRG